MTNTLKSHPANSITDECPLTSTEILAVCKEFASITNTDTDLAMIMLQQNRWNLEHAICAYLDLSIDKQKSSIKKMNEQYQASSVFVFLNIKSNNFHLLSSQ
jgi:hypothetical protein